MTLSSHAVVGIIEMIFYICLLAPTLHNLIHYGIKDHVSWLYLALFACIKIAGAAILLYISTHSNASSGLQEAMQILYSVALGPLLSATLSFMNPRQPYNPSSQRSSGGPIRIAMGALNQATSRAHGDPNAPPPPRAGMGKILKLVHLVILIGVALAVSGGIDQVPNSDGTRNKNLDSGVSHTEIAVILLLIAYLAIAGAAAAYFPVRHQLPEPQRTILTYIILALPLLGLRLLYSILGAFNSPTTSRKGSSTFNMFRGSLAAYIIMAMLTQIGVVVLYTVGGYVARDRVRRTQWGTQRAGGRPQRVSTARRQDVEVGREGYRMTNVRN